MVRQGFTVERDVDYAEAFRFAANQGFDFVELNMDHAFERQRIDAQAVRRAAADRDLSVVVHLPYQLDPGSPHEHVRRGACRELEASIDTAAAVGAEKVIFHGTSWADPEKWDRTDIQEHLYDSIRRITTYARDHDLTACVENLKTEFFDAGDFPALFERTNALACLDTAHAHVTGQSLATQAELVRDHSDRISHIHLNETRLNQTDEHLPVGLGRLNFSALARAIRDTGWIGTCTHEIALFDLEYAAHSKEAFDRLPNETSRTAR